MSNAFIVQPELPTPFPAVAAWWTCPITGLAVPKDPAKNLEWRAKLLAAADKDRGLQEDLYTACSKSILFYINAFCFTLRVFEPGEDGDNVQSEYTHLPFVTWEIQDRHILRVNECIDKGQDLLTDKSRDMGATWNHIAVYSHRLNFKNSESHLLLSRKEDAVDQLDGLPRGYPYGPLADPGTLFGKLDYIQSRLPEWMQPRLLRKKMHLVNLDTSVRIDGESANATAGTSDRRKSIMLDEMAKMLEAESIKRSTRDVSACRLPVSTPNGAGTTFSKWRMSGTIPVFILPWWEHPEKGVNRYCSQDDLGRWKIRSPWYDNEETKRSPKEMSIEIDMDHVGSGDTFFEPMIIEQHRRLFAKAPRMSFALSFKSELPEAQINSLVMKRDTKSVLRTPKGKWRWWAGLMGGRPDQTRTYTLGIDIGKGMGASNSVISVFCNETKEKIGEFACANTPPYELAKLACAAAIWIGGSIIPLIIWENNGDPGFDFGRQLVRVYNYPRIYFDKQVGTTNEKRGKRFGWRSSQEKKALGLGGLRRAYAHGGFINHSEEALEEALGYITYPTGSIGPATLFEESEAARKTHGDRVIADMLCLIGCGDTAPMSRPVASAPYQSPAYRMQQYKKKLKRHSDPRRFVGANYAK